MKEDGETRFYLKISGAWDLLLQSLTAGPISSADSPNLGRIPFDQAQNSAERGIHLLASLSLSWLVAASAPILQKQEEMREVLSTGTLSGQGQCSDPPQINSGPDFPAAPQLSTVNRMVRIFVVRHQSSQMRSEVNTCCCFSLFMLHTLAVC